MPGFMQRVTAWMSAHKKATIAGVLGVVAAAMVANSVVETSRSQSEMEQLQREFAQSQSVETPEEFEEVGEGSWFGDYVGADPLEEPRALTEEEVAALTVDVMQFDTTSTPREQAIAAIEDLTVPDLQNLGPEGLNILAPSAGIWDQGWSRSYRVDAVEFVSKDSPYGSGVSETWRVDGFQEVSRAGEVQFSGAMPLTVTTQCGGEDLESCRVTMVDSGEVLVFDAIVAEFEAVQEMVREASEE